VRRRPAERIGVLLVCVVAGAIVLVPFLMILLNSVKDERHSALFRLTLPTVLVLANYAGVFEQSNIVRGFENSFIICFLTLVIDNLFAAMAAYVIQRKRSFVNRTSFLLFFLGLIVPVSIIPTIRLMMEIHVYNSYLGIVLYYTATVLPFSIFLLTGFMKSIPRELDESALIEGSTYLRLFVQIIMPLLVTALITVTIVVTVAVWNDFFAPFYLLSDSTKWTIMLSVFDFISKYQTNWGVVFAFMMIVISPILIVYFALQHYIIDGLTAGSLKG
jgi:raffinose/stachyose/melibiose transport system permease protein